MLTDVKHFSDVKTGAIIVSWQQLWTPAVWEEQHNINMQLIQSNSK